MQRDLDEIGQLPTTMGESIGITRSRHIVGVTHEVDVMRRLCFLLVPPLSHKKRRSHKPTQRMFYGRDW
jgi:hypothetical protein